MQIIVFSSDDPEYTASELARLWNVEAVKEQHGDGPVHWSMYLRGNPHSLLEVYPSTKRRPHGTVRALS